MWLTCVVSGCSNRWFKPRLDQSVVSISEALNLHCFCRLNCEMSARCEHPHKERLFIAIRSPEVIALKNQRIYFMIFVNVLQ